jgi:hypothetical protein
MAIHLYSLRLPAVADDLLVLMTTRTDRGGIAHAELFAVTDEGKLAYTRDCNFRRPADAYPFVQLDEETLVELMLRAAVSTFAAEHKRSPDEVQSMKVDAKFIAMRLLGGDKFPFGSLNQATGDTELHELLHQLSLIQPLYISG